MVYAQISTGISNTFNRTIEELKSLDARLKTVETLTFNRTIEELKLNTLVAIAPKNKLLIAP